MTATKPPRFYTSVDIDVDVDIDPDELEGAGWVYVGEGDDPGPTNARTVDTVMRWHDDYHEDPWMWCTHVLCRQLNR